MQLIYPWVSTRLRFLLEIVNMIIELSWGWELWRILARDIISNQWISRRGNSGEGELRKLGNTQDRLQVVTDEFDLINLGTYSILLSFGRCEVISVSAYDWALRCCWVFGVLAMKMCFGLGDGRLKLGLKARLFSNMHIIHDSYTPFPIYFPP